MRARTHAERERNEGRKEERKGEERRGREEGKERDSLSCICMLQFIKFSEPMV